MKPKMYHIPELDRKGLRGFALVSSGLIVGGFGLLLPWLLNVGWPTWPWILAAILTTIGFVTPMSLQQVYRLWMLFGILLSKITNPIIMGLVFFLMITPIGLVRRLLSSDPMARKFHNEDSYRITCKKTSAKNMERPF